MNKKGLAMSMVIYAVILLIISLLYMLLGIVRNRYTINDDLRKAIIRDLNSDEYMYPSLDDNCIEEEIVSVSECEETTSKDVTITCNYTNDGIEMHYLLNKCVVNSVENE